MGSALNDLNQLERGRYIRALIYLEHKFGTRLIKNFTQQQLAQAMLYVDSIIKRNKIQVLRKIVNKNQDEVATDTVNTAALEQEDLEAPDHYTSYSHLYLENPNQKIALSSANILVNTEPKFVPSLMVDSQSSYSQNGAVFNNEPSNTTLIGSIAAVGIAAGLAGSGGGGSGAGNSKSQPPTPAATNVNESPIGSPTIAGIAQVNRILTAQTKGISDANGLNEFMYVWIADGQEISRSKRNTLTLTKNVVGKLISVQVHYVDKGGFKESIGSESSQSVAAALETPTMHSVTSDNALTATEGLSTVPIYGTAIGSNSIRLIIGEHVFSIAPDNNGNWQLDLSNLELGKLGNGLHRITVEASDRFGNQLTSYQYIFITDTVSSRKDPNEDGLFRISFYSSTSVLETALEHVSPLGGIGVDYHGNPNAATIEKLYDNNLYSPFTLKISSPQGTPLSTYLAELYNLTYSQVREALLNPHGAITITTWYLPEEARPWRQEDMGIAREIVRAIRQAESDLGVTARPIEAYQPNHSDASRLDSFHGIYDIISKGAYGVIGDSSLHSSIQIAAQLMVESSRAQAGNRAVGVDFTPEITLGAYSDPVAGTTLSDFRKAIRVGFYGAIAEGIQGMSIWSYATRVGFSRYWRDQYFDEYVALSREINVIEPALGQSITRGLRLENISQETPLTFTTSTDTVVVSRFFNNGMIFVVMVNRDTKASASVGLDTPANFTRYQETLIPQEVDWSNWNDSLNIFLAPLSVRIFRFKDPNASVSSHIGQIPSIDSLEMILRQGWAGSGLGNDGQNQIVKWILHDPDSRGLSNLSIEIWGINGFGTSDSASHYFFRIDTPKVAITKFTAQEVNQGLIGFYYSGSQEAPKFSVRISDDRGVSSGWIEANAHFYFEGKSGTGGILLYGDGSGSGGGGGYGTGSGGDGGSGDDALMGSNFADVIFGDGSGGGEGPNFGSGRAAGVAGNGGGGNDFIMGGDGSDILFGDGFAGSQNLSNSTYNLGTLGGYGGGGSGGGNATGSIGGGGGGSAPFDNGVNTKQGEVNSIGVNLGANGPSAGNAHMFPGSGLGVSAVGLQGDSQAVQAFLINATYEKVLQDISQAIGYDTRIFTQVMGAGNDILDGGLGDDWIMGGYGDDRIIGGAGNDHMWGRGGGISTASTIPSDNDFFIWQTNDAGMSGALDVIKDFEKWNGSTGDRLDISEFLLGYTRGVSNIADWVQIVKSKSSNSEAWHTHILIDVDGVGVKSITQSIILENSDLFEVTPEKLIEMGVLFA